MILGNTDRTSLENIFTEIAHHYHTAEANRADGLKLDFADSWVHLRPSNTEPIVRIYSEAPSKVRAEELASELKHEIEKRVAGINSDNE